MSYNIESVTNMTAYIGMPYHSTYLYKKGGETWKGSLTEAKRECKRLNKEQSTRCGLYPTHFLPVEAT